MAYMQEKHAGRPSGTLSTFINRLKWFDTRISPCQKESACIYLLQLACAISWNWGRLEKLFFKWKAQA